MKKILPLLLTAVLLFAVTACSDTAAPVEIILPHESGTEAKLPASGEATDQPQEEEQEAVEVIPMKVSAKPIEHKSFNFTREEMPEPFEFAQNAGGNDEIVKFASPTFNDNWGRSLNVIEHSYVRPFVDMNVYSEWYYGFPNPDNLDEPLLALTDYPNIYSLIITFDIPVDELREIMQYAQSVLANLDFDYFTDEEIDLILSLDEAAIMEHFISDYSFFNEGYAFTPQWLYLHTEESYEKAGITPEMLEEKLELYSGFSFTAEAAVAFESKLSSFLGERVSFDDISKNGWTSSADRDVSGDAVSDAVNSDRILSDDRVSQEVSLS